jgi:hypothetical protein
MPPAPSHPLHVVPAAHVAVRPPLHLTVHAAALPQTIVQVALPWQSAVQPPPGQLSVQELLPVHDSVEPAPTLTLQVLPPPQLTLLSTPASRLHVLVPSQTVVQFEPHVPPQEDCPAQLLVQPVPQDRLQLFFDWQSSVVLFGGAASPPAPPSAVPAPPSAHVAPLAQVQVLPLHVHEPVHAMAPPASTPFVVVEPLPHPIAMPTTSPSAPKALTTRSFDIGSPPAVIVYRASVRVKVGAAIMVRRSAS